MTAVVGVLNKQAVALAADSAFTIYSSSGTRIFNKANKVFALSKHHPVGIMIYNSAGFMATPWETIIKVYRKQLGTTSFSTLKEYQENFISFLKAKQFYSTPDEQKLFFKEFAKTVIQALFREVKTENKELVLQATDASKADLLAIVEHLADVYTQQFEGDGNFCDDFADYSYDSFAAYAEEILNEVISEIFVDGFNPSDHLKSKLKKLTYLYLRTKEELTTFTGLIFAGFGENEIYPSLIPLNISRGVDGRLRYYIYEEKVAKINNTNPGAVRPFAQTDVIDTILTGIDPDLERYFNANFKATFTKYNQELLSLIGNSNEELAAQIQGLNIDDLLNAYANENLATKRRHYIHPLMNAVSSLSKDDLAEMAESLIYTTYLKRRITFAEESVGGPVDVAIISKGDGFIWIKRKHYFKPELNRHFFDNYLNQ